MSSVAFDLAALVPERQAVKPPLLHKLRTTHHELARLLACGLKDVEISRMTGYSQSRICILKQDPMFKELVDSYMVARDASAIDFSSRLQALSMTAVEIMQERLEDEGDAVSFKDLRQIAEFGADRTGFGPTSKVESTSTLRVQTLEEIKASIEKEHRGRVISRNLRLEASEIIDGETVDHSAAEAPQGSESQGD